MIKEKIKSIKSDEGWISVRSTDKGYRLLPVFKTLPGNQTSTCLPGEGAKFWRRVEIQAKTALNIPFILVVDIEWYGTVEVQTKGYIRCQVPRILDKKVISEFMRLTGIELEDREKEMFSPKSKALCM